MIEFSKKDENRQFISVHILSKVSPSNFLAQLKTVFSSLSNANTLTDQEELLIEIPETNQLGFSLSEFRRIVASFTEATVKCFTVDVEEEDQRNYW